MKDKIQTGIQSLPREPSLSEDGVLRIQPLRELEQLRTDEQRLKNITVESDTTHVLEEIAGDTMELEIVLEVPSARKFGVKVLCDKDGENGFAIASGKASRELKAGHINPPFELRKGEELALRVLVDKNMLEVFASDRQAAVPSHEYDPHDLDVSLFSKVGDLKCKSVSSWQMKSCY